MRTLLAFLAVTPVAGIAAEPPSASQSPAVTAESVATSGPPASTEVQTIVVTAAREARLLRDTAASLRRIEAREISDLSAKHHDELLNRSAGVFIQHGSGQESLGAIRSPVLSGPGACGAFLITEDSLPIRPVGFCNLNEMFEVNYEQAGGVEILRGPGSALYGASAAHGIVNILTPKLSALPPYSLGFETGSDDFRRLRGGFAHEFSEVSLGAYGAATRAPGWRDASGVDEMKLNLLADVQLGAGELKLRAAGTVLNQETAGFIQGFNAYRDESLARSNLNPEAYRDASSARASAQYQQPCGIGNDCEWQLAGLYRRSRMDFLQHFLIGKPTEHNAQTSYRLESALAFSPAKQWRLRLALDAEFADSELTEFQSGPATDGAPAANAIRPAGYHYDYGVASDTVGATAGVEYTFARNWVLSGALRADRTSYDYDNHMLTGNTRADGTACGAAGCLYSRPADRADGFDNFAPRITLAWNATPHQLWYLSGSRGFRPPEMTELYRLQRQQSVADLDSEELDATELGWRFTKSGLELSAALYAMKKSNLILRESNAFNVSNGATTHRGFEYEARWQLNRFVRISAAGSYARHEYDFSRAVEGGETITAGNDVDTAPRHLHNLGVEVDFAAGWRAALDGVYVGSYYVDAANAASYPGHKIANLRFSWEAYEGLTLATRIDNVFDTAYADRADFAFGNYRYFPAQGRAVFVSVDYSAH
jgi:iron complex outermembrane recepter protein